MIRRVCFRSPFLSFFGEMPSIHSRPEAWGPLRGTVCSTNSAICLHHAHPFVAASEKSTCLMQRSKAFGHAIVVSKMFWNIVIVLSVVLWDCCKPTNTCRDWAFSNSGLEVGLPAFQLPMFAKCDALPKGDLLEMFVSGVHSCHSFGKCQASNPYQKLELPESRVRSAISALNHGCIMPIPSLQLQKKPVICREAEGLVAELWSPRFVTIQWLCSQLCYVTAANQRTIVEMELLATVSWKWGCQPLSCRCWQNLMRCRKEICWTCLFKNWRNRQITESLSLKHSGILTKKILFNEKNSAFCLRYACQRSHPFVQDSGFVSHVERHRFGHGVVVSKVCYGILERVFSHLPCYCNESRLSF